MSNFFYAEDSTANPLPNRTRLPAINLEAKTPLTKKFKPDCVGSRLIASKTLVPLMSANYKAMPAKLTAIAVSRIRTQLRLRKMKKMA